MDNIRNFCIIAHIDHGKSTLADRLLQITGVVGDHEFRDQMLDTMDIERERGITIKSQTVALPYRSQDGKDYVLNLIDTPGHADFSYEVSRALVSCEGALLVIDASQGVQAQTLANFYMAVEQDLEIIPVINKIDLPSADVEGVKLQIEKDLGLDAETAVAISAKEGIGIEEVLEAVVTKVPAPKGDPAAPLRALIFDSHWDPYRGTIVHLRIFDGELRPGDTIRFWFNSASYRVEETGIFLIDRTPRRRLRAGEVGYIIAGIKTVSDTRIGDTVTLDDKPCKEPLKGFKVVKPVVFYYFYPI
jgi:GTP-binding protein LepA